ncbi:MAG: hypothetical protein ABR542_03930, partial [Desulfonatronovibrio sp.]
MSEKKEIFLEKEIESSFVARKRLFIGLITTTSILVCLILILLWLVPFVGLQNIHPVAPWILGGVIVLGILFVAWASLSLVLNILLKR